MPSHRKNWMQEPNSTGEDYKPITSELFGGDTEHSRRAVPKRTPSTGSTNQQFVPRTKATNPQVFGGPVHVVCFNFSWRNISVKISHSVHLRRKLSASNFYFNGIDSKKLSAYRRGLNIVSHSIHTKCHRKRSTTRC